MTAKSWSELLLARADAVGGRAIAEMYQDPFWDERFGPRGRRFAEEDGRHHVSYLAAALDANDAGVLTKYATWLRNLLVSRGMCTRHVEENYRRLGHAIEAEQLPGAREANALLEVAITSLLYPGGPARQLQDASPRLAAHLAASWLEAYPEWGTELRARFEPDLAQHLSYLADAIACGRPELFAGYAKFIAAFSERRGLKPGAFAGLLRELVPALAGIDPALEASAQQALVQALIALGSGA